MSADKNALLNQPINERKRRWCVNCSQRKYHLFTLGRLLVVWRRFTHTQTHGIKFNSFFVSPRARQQFSDFILWSFPCLVLIRPFSLSHLNNSVANYSVYYFDLHTCRNQSINWHNQVQVDEWEWEGERESAPTNQLQSSMLSHIFWIQRPIDLFVVIKTLTRPPYLLYHRTLYNLNIHSLRASKVVNTDHLLWA